MSLRKTAQRKIMAQKESLAESKKLIEQAREVAVTKDNAKSEFLSRMSHELRTPLNAILGFAQVLEMEELTEKQKGSVREILTAGNHLLELVNEVLDLSRIESGKLDLSIEPVDLARVISECITEIFGWKLIRPVLPAPLRWLIMCAPRR